MHTQTIQKSLTLTRLGRVFAAASCLLAATTAHAELRVADIFGDHMVLQREKDVPVWGWTDPGSTVDIAFAGQKVSAKANADGKWMAKLTPMPANTTGAVMTVTSGSETATFTDVLVGEVWLAAGQSNMRAGGPDKDTGLYPFYQSPDKDLPPMRVRNFGFGASLEPVEDFPVPGRKKEWDNLVIKDGDSIPEYFTRILRDSLDVPVGMIIVAFPGTNQAAWMSKETLEKFPGKDGNFYEEFLAEKNEALAAKPQKGTIKTWDDLKAQEEAWLAEPKGRYPGNGLSEMYFVNWPTALYNTRIFPLAPYALRGVIWHQGEAGPGGPYGERLVAMFNQWRELFGQDFYAVWGTLARYTKDQPPLYPVRKGFYRSNNNVSIRQGIEVGDDKMELIEFYDLGSENTHFTEKAEAGRRMALGVLDLVYNEDHIYTGPRVADIKFDGATAYVKFDHIGEKVVYVPSLEGISGVIIVDPKGNNEWANVEVINESTIKLSHPNIQQIAMVAYADHPNPHETLFNSAGLPASPFTETSGTVGRSSAPESTATLINVLSGKADLHLNHVRREGYMFEFRGKGVATVNVQTYIPAEWNGYEVLVDGQPITTETAEVDGNKYAQFDAPVNSGQITVCQQGGAGKFSGIDRY